MASAVAFEDEINSWKRKSYDRGDFPPTPSTDADEHPDGRFRGARAQCCYRRQRMKKALNFLTFCSDLTALPSFDLRF